MIHAAYKLEHIMIIVKKNLRDICEVMITYSKEQKSELT